MKNELRTKKTPFGTGLFCHALSITSSKNTVDGSSDKKVTKIYVNDGYLRLQEAFLIQPKNLSMRQNVILFGVRDASILVKGKKEKRQ